jgi:hypothetical protein
MAVQQVGLDHVVWRFRSRRFTEGTTLAIVPLVALLVFAAIAGFGAGVVGVLAVLNGESTVAEALSLLLPFAGVAVAAGTPLWVVHRKHTFVFEVLDRRITLNGVPVTRLRLDFRKGMGQLEVNGLSLQPSEPLDAPQSELILEAVAHARAPRPPTRGPPPELERLRASAQRSSESHRV